MEILYGIVCVVGGYLLGSISFSRIICRIKDRDGYNDDISVSVEGTDISYKVLARGASAASMKYGAKTGILISVFDILIIFIPTLLLRLLFPQEPYMFLYAAAGMAGHNWPLYHSFKGGRGISSYYGGLFAIDPIGALVTMAAGMIFGFAIIRDYFIAYLAGMWFLLPWVIFKDGRPWFIAYAVFVNIIHAIAMYPDFKQYLEIKKKVKVDPKMVLETTPMGRGMLKMSEWFSNLFKKKSD
jgi:glycerol-3-phosphate acyltransferase PlsY